MFLIAKIIYENPPEHITIALKEEADLEKVKNDIPFSANVSITDKSEKYPLMNDKITYYVYKNHVCLSPQNKI